MTKTVRLEYHGTNPFRTLAHHVKWTTIQILNNLGDRRLGIDASGHIDPSDLESSGPNATNFYVYLGTPHTVLSLVFRLLPVDFSKYGFVDFGSGKGRVVSHAAQYPFRSVHGVELSPILHEAAGKNVARLKPGPRERIHLSNGDVLEFLLPATPLVLFNFNSFNKTVLSRLVANIEADIAKNPRDCWLVYLNPRNDAVVRENSRFEPVELPGHAKRLIRILSPWPLAIYRMPQAASN